MATLYHEKKKKKKNSNQKVPTFIIEDWGGRGQIQEVGPHNMDCVRGGLGACTQEILHVLKCVLGGLLRLLFVHAL